MNIRTQILVVAVAVLAFLFLIYMIRGNRLKLKYSLFWFLLVIGILVFGCFPGLTKALAKELSPSGITVNCITPGVIDTEMNGCLDACAKEELIDEIPLQRMGKPSEVANLALFLASEGSDYITGQIIGISGGMVI